MTELSMYQRMRSGQLYVAEDREIARLGQIAQRNMWNYNNMGPDASAEQRRAALEAMLAEVGSDVVIRPPVYIDYGFHTYIGARTFVNYNCTLLDVADIRIGENCLLAPGVQLLTAWHPLEPTPRKEAWEAGSPITIGNNVWLSANVLVLPGVSIADNSVIGAGSVVTKDIEANVVAAGNPARVIRALPEDCPSPRL